ncbi:hypothetical protein JXJ21_03470 [candidate division KSB1 bacterium]|nr:hypothetical protein [candidate division KSB1 bacterium]
MKLNLKDKQWQLAPWEDPQFDPDLPHFQNLERYHHRGFVSEGTMVALPLCFPGMTTPIPPDESAITALEIDDKWRIYGGTSGRQAHLFCAFTRGVTGMVHDLGPIPEATSCSSVMIGNDFTVYAAASGADAGWIVAHAPEKIPYDCLQEWGFYRTPYQKIAEPVPGEAIAHAVYAAAENAIYGISAKTGTLFEVALDAKAVTLHPKVDPVHKFGTRLLLYRNLLLGTNFDGKIWQFDLDTKFFRQTDLMLPCAAGRQFHNQVQTWVVDERGEIIYGSSTTDGFLFAYNPIENTVRSLGKPAVSRAINCLAVTQDGRLFGITGQPDEISHLFCYDPDSHEFKDLGVPVSVFNERAYGYHFQSAVTGKDGEIIFGQAERVSNLWLYFPAIVPSMHC